jgi:hypothetical protein
MRCPQWHGDTADFEFESLLFALRQEEGISFMFDPSSVVLHK